jgi:hypothetical protein
MKINLPTASTTLKGGIKVGTGVEVVNEKLNVKVATANEVAGVLSSADEGKVAVNNDGTMTYNPLGYRKPSTTYAAGDIAYHASLPTGWYLECTTAGTTSANDLTIATPTVNSTITDGTVVWTINKDLSLLGGTINGDLTVVGEINGINFSENKMSFGDSFNIYNEKDTTNINIFGGTKTLPATSARLSLYGGSSSNGNAGKFVLESATANDSVKLVGEQNGNLVWGSNDLAGSAIVAKSLSANGYIKYASGLIIQWGRLIPSATEQTITFPISFSISTSYSTLCGLSASVAAGVSMVNMTASTAKIVTASGNTSYQHNWVAVGY